MTSIVERLTNRPRRTETITLAVDPNDATKLARLRLERDNTRGNADRAAKRAEGADGDNAEALAATAEERETEATTAEADYDEFVAAVVTFTVELQSVPMSKASEIEAAHPPTKDQRVAARNAANGDPKAEPAHNPETFPAAFLAESITWITLSDDPDNPEGPFTVEQVAAMYGSWSDQDRSSVYQMAEMLTVAGTQVGDLGKD